MGRRFVDAIWIKQRMQAKDDRGARDLAAQQRRVNVGRRAVLPSEILPYASVEIVRVPPEIPTPIAPADVAPAPRPPSRCVGRHWWYWIGPSLLKCKRCGAAKRAEK